jgi:hypothetical protein
MQDLIQQAVDSYPNVPAWQTVLALSHLHAGAGDAGAACLHDFLDRRAEGIAYFDRPGLCFAASAAHELGDADAAARILEGLSPDEQGVIVVGVGAAVLGPVDLYVGICEAVLGRTDAARHHLDGAVARSEALGWATWARLGAELRAST